MCTGSHGVLALPAVFPLSPVTGSKSTPAGEVTVYVDLAYIPSGASAPTINTDFFRCIRSSCYIISGDSPEREELLRHTLDALLDSKSSWAETTQVEHCYFFWLQKNIKFLFLHPSSSQLKLTVYFCVNCLNLCMILYKCCRLLTWKQPQIETINCRRVLVVGCDPTLCIISLHLNSFLCTLR